MGIVIFDGFDDSHFNASHPAHIETDYSPSLVAFSVVISVIGSLCAVYTMREYPRARNFLQRSILVFVFSLAIGGVTIWAMHFCALFALNIHFIDEIDGEIPLAQQFDEAQTALSMLFGIAVVFLGALVASQDPFFSKDKATQVEVLNNLISMKEAVKLSSKKLAFKALFARPWYIIVGGIISGSGVAKTHYWGVDSKFKDHYKIEWDYFFVVLSIVISILQFILGFWLVFRFLQWKPKREGHRIFSALCISTGCLSLHYVGMAGANYLPQIHIGEHPDGLVEGELVFEHSLMFAFICTSMILLILINYISYFSILSDFEREMTRFILELETKASSQRDPSIALREIRVLLERYQKAFNSLISSQTRSQMAHKRSSVTDSSGMKYGISQLNSGINIDKSVPIEGILESVPQVESLT